MAEDPKINPNPYIDPQNAELLEQLGTLLNGRDLTSLPLAEQREIFGEASLPIPPHPNVQISYFDVKTSYGNVRTFVFRPKDNNADLPFVYHVHGGGWILGTVQSFIGFMSAIVERTGYAVVFPEYTLAPLRKFPAQQEQCVEVLQYLVRHGHERKLLVDKVVVSGDSAGGQLAPAISIINQQRSLHLPIAHQILFSPIIDTSSLTSTFSQFEFQNGPLLTNAFIQESIDNYLPNAKDRLSITASPIFMNKKEAKTCMPPTTILTSQADWLRDQGNNFAKLLQQAGVSCGVVETIATLHDFLAFNKSRASPTADLALLMIAGKIKEVLGDGDVQGKTADGPEIHSSSKHLAMMSKARLAASMHSDELQFDENGV